MQRPRIILPLLVNIIPKDNIPFARMHRHIQRGEVGGAALLLGQRVEVAEQGDLALAASLEFALCSREFRAKVVIMRNVL